MRFLVLPPIHPILDMKTPSIAVLCSLLALVPALGAEPGEKAPKRQSQPTKVEAPAPDTASGKKKAAPKEAERMRDQDLRKKLASMRDGHKKAVAAVNASHDKSEQLEKKLQSQRAKADELTAALEKVRSAVANTQNELVVTEEIHEKAHAQELELKKMVEHYEEEDQRRNQIAELERQARELHKKAEALRKKAEELRK